LRDPEVEESPKKLEGIDTIPEWELNAPPIVSVAPAAIRVPL